MSLTIHRQARVDAQRRISLRHASFQPGTLVDVVAVAPQARANKRRSLAYSLFDQLQTLAGKLDRQWSCDGSLQADADLPSDYSLNFEKTLYPRHR